MHLLILQRSRALRLAAILLALCALTYATLPTQAAEPSQSTRQNDAPRTAEQVTAEQHSAEQQAFAEQQVTVTLESGRTFTGSIDPQTSDDVFWLSVQRTGISIRRPIAWNSVVRGTLNERTLARDALRAEILKLAATQKPSATPRPTPPRTTVRDEQPPQPATKPTPPLRRPRVASLNLYADLANWDSDADPDGLIVSVEPLDATGQVVSATGSIEFRLYVEEAAQMIHNAQLTPTQRWVHKLSFDPETYRSPQMKLTFQGWFPTRDTHLGTYARLEARLTVPGQGTFDAVCPLVRIRTFDPLSDRIEQYRVKHH